MNQTIRKSKLKEGEIIPIAIDYVFTNIFNNPDNIILLENFLACYLEVPVSELKGNVKLLNRNLILEHKKEANKQVDLLVDIGDEKINIELQNQMLAGIIDRNVAFACKVHARQLKSEEDSYQKIKKTLQINLTRKTNEELKESYYLTNEKGNILTKKIEIVLIDMEKAKEKCYTEEKLARWCKAIIATNKKDLKEAVGDDLMEKEAKELLESEVDKYSDDEEAYVVYSKYTKEELERNTFYDEVQENAKKWAEEYAEQQLKERIEQVKQQVEKQVKQQEKEKIQQKMEETKKQEQKEIAKRMLKKDVDIKEICELTGLIEKEIEELR